MQYWKGNPQGRKLFDNLTGQDGMSVEELCNIASALHCKCEELKIVLEVYEDSLNKLEKENKELKQFKEKVFEIIDEHIVKERRFPREISPSEKRAMVIERRIGKVELLETLKKELSE